MNYIYYTLEAGIILLAETIIYWLFCNGLYERKQKGWKCGLILIFYPVSFLIGSYCCAQGLPVILKVIGLVIVGSIITKLLFNGDWRSIIVHLIILFVCSIISDGLALGNLSIIQHGVGINKIFSTYTLLMHAEILSKIFHFIIVSIFIKKFGKETNRYTIFETLIFMLQGISGFVCLMLVIYLSMNLNAKYKLSTLSVMVVSSLILVSYFVFYGVLDKYIKKRNIEQEVMSVHFYNQGQYEYYASLEQENLNIRKMYYDLRNQLLTIQNLNNKNTDIGNAYIQKYLETVNGYNVFFDTGNKLADIIFYDKCNSAKNYNITTKVKIQKGSLDKLDMIDLCTILTNSFDNAMEACKQCKGDRFIQVKTIKNDAAVILTFKNNYETLPSMNTKGELITNKQNKTEHNLGMQSLEIATSKYNGNVEISIDKQKKEFLLVIMLPLAYQKAS